MTPMQMRQVPDPAPTMLLGVDYGAGVRLMVELVEPFQPRPFTDEVHWKAKVWRGTREMGGKYDGAIIAIKPEQRVLLPSKQR